MFAKGWMFSPFVNESVPSLTTTWFRAEARGLYMTVMEDLKASAVEEMCQCVWDHWSRRDL